MTSSWSRGLYSTTDDEARGGGRRGGNEGARSTEHIHQLDLCSSYTRCQYDDVTWGRFSESTNQLTRAYSSVSADAKWCSDDTYTTQSSSIRERTACVGAPAVTDGCETTISAAGWSWRLHRRASDHLYFAVQKFANCSMSSARPLHPRVGFRISASIWSVETLNEDCTEKYPLSRVQFQMTPTKVTWCSAAQRNTSFARKPTCLHDKRRGEYRNHARGASIHAAPVGPTNARRGLATGSSLLHV